jgi:Fe-S-cluster containining protein
MSSFPCSGCGCCCRRINQAVSHFKAKSKKDPMYFPYTWDENGVCENLTEDNKCKVYDKRPLICNIESYGNHMKVNEQEFYQANIRACNYMMDLDNIPLEFRIK